MDIGNLATALGAKSFKVEQPEKIAPALKEAIASVKGGTTGRRRDFHQAVKNQPLPSVGAAVIAAPFAA